MPRERIKLFVIDTSPLITLAAAQSLDYLLYPALPVILPDAVFYEATVSADKLGAQEIVAWQRDNASDVTVAPTRVFAAYSERFGDGRRYREPDLGERAALELLRETKLLGPHERGLFLLEDSQLMTQHFLTADKERVIPITTHDLLALLEDQHRIQSADAVLARAREAGRTIKRYTLYQDHPPQVRDAVRDVIERAHRDREPDPPH